MVKSVLNLSVPVEPPKAHRPCAGRPYNHHHTATLERLPSISQMDTACCTSSCLSGAGVSQNAVGEAAAEAPEDKVKRHLAGSIYLWACGDNSTQDSEKLVLTDVLIGWLVPLVRTSSIYTKHASYGKRSPCHILGIPPFTIAMSDLPYETHVLL